MSILPQSQVEHLARAAERCGLTRPDLLARLERHLPAHLHADRSATSEPREQLIADLVILTSSESRRPHLLLWLEHAAVLSDGRPESQFFQQMADRLDRPAPPDPTTSRAALAKEAIRRLRGSAWTGLSTDEVLEMTRGE